MARKKGTSAAKKKLYEIYRSTNRRLDNKIRKIKRHIKRLPGDLQAQDNLKRILG